MLHYCSAAHRRVTVITLQYWALLKAEHSLSHLRVGINSVFIVAPSNHPYNAFDVGYLLQQASICLHTRETKPRAEPISIGMRIIETLPVEPRVSATNL